ncbi:MAG: FdtA/QdtA family cupin domain-containing protein [Bacteroides sp.]|nr:FdtA/QdtA family cupin domain-containing protein [Bacteroides sp.]MCM1414261.1 FdtA/QdtA family cupin domain-containing protein [Bacteroides sp.]MCM1472405.1 FdtA/QdtA family cupin domain-containing protein [Bacteroides sp.]
MELEKPQLIELPKICDHRGNLTFAQTPEHVPFDIARVYWLYDLPADAERGGHAHRSVREMLVALSGSFNVNLYIDGKWQRVTLNRPYRALYLPAGVWRTLDDFTSGSVCLVLASEPFCEEEYIRDFEEYVAFEANKRGESE